MDKATNRIKYYNNENGPVIGVTSQNVIEQDGYFFRDSNGDGKLAIYKDWRKSPKERAEALAKELSVDEKLGLIFVNQIGMGIYQKDDSLKSHNGIFDEEITEKGKTIFAVERVVGTTETLKDKKIRHIILRTNPQPAELVDWINELNAVAEEQEQFIPVTVLSNSRNEHGEIVFGMNDAAGVFATYPGTLGIGAAVTGTGDLTIIDKLADCIKEEWNAVGMKKGYMYMADVMSDPRWQRSYGTFGENPDLICNIMEHLIPRVQGSEDGVTEDGVALTIKHFPGGGARENGFDPHYRQGQWNVYQTENSLQKYHLPSFRVAIEKKAASIMPYYAKPSAEKSEPQFDELGNQIPMSPKGFAYNKEFIQDLLRDQMHFEGYINSDSGIAQMMSWGVEELDVPERIALAINTGVDIISGSMDVEAAKESFERGRNGYYETHEIKAGYTKELLTLSEEALNQATARTLEEQFKLGSFENPYRDAEKAEQVIATKEHWIDAEKVHRQSVVVLKNKDQVLPLTDDKLHGKNVYAKVFGKDEKVVALYNKELDEMLSADSTVKRVDDYTQADYAILYLNPSSGEYFNATKGYLELEICEGKTVPNVDDEGRPTEETHEETTLVGMNEIRKIAEAVHANGGKVISNINFTLAWMVGAVEQNSDALLAGFDTYKEAIWDVIRGEFKPVGKMPITLPKDDSVILVNQDGKCISPNDVPGYDKDQYMPEDLKDENGKAYAYRDSEGNYYELNFGLTF